MRLSVGSFNTDLYRILQLINIQYKTAGFLYVSLWDPLANCIAVIVIAPVTISNTP